MWSKFGNTVNVSWIFSLLATKTQVSFLSSAAWESDKSAELKVYSLWQVWRPFHSDRFLTQPGLCGVNHNYKQDFVRLLYCLKPFHKSYFSVCYSCRLNCEVPNGVVLSFAGRLKCTEVRVQSSRWNVLKSFYLLLIIVHLYKQDVYI